ncbi:MAG: threonine synthase [Phycisphaeraceae bacterium]|nr:MAG: threonine synthase [Phycisphaeraceae bacterium]
MNLVCRSTGERFDADLPIWRGPSGGLLDLEFEARFPVDTIRGRPPGLWRYREALPLPEGAEPVTFGEGSTPLVPQRWAGREVLIKLDTLFPTGSYKDRGSTVLISHARRIGVTRLLEDSSGNAGASMAAYASRAGIACDIYAPASASPAKLAQIRLAGANLVAVPGTRADTAAAALEAAGSVYYASHSYNPFFVHGTKTFAYEIAEALGWRAPDAVVIPTGNGTLLLGAFIGFNDLRAAGITDRVPRLIAVQSSACAPLHAAFEGRAFGSASPTIAEGIAIPAPVRAGQCVEAVRVTGGFTVAVDDGATNRAWNAALRAGLFIEPTCATALAALGAMGSAAGDLGERVVVAATGHALKASDLLAKSVGSR